MYAANIQNIFRPNYFHYKELLYNGAKYIKPTNTLPGTFIQTDNTRYYIEFKPINLILPNSPRKFNLQCQTYIHSTVYMKILLLPIIWQVILEIGFITLGDIRKYGVHIQLFNFYQNVGAYIK